MSELWKKCEGQLVNEQFPLLKFLANTNHSAVFLTNLKLPEPCKAALKFISADIPAPDQQLAIWERATQLSHPQLLRIFHHGRCRLAGMDLLYLITEHADENLSQFLPQRALTPDETRDMLDPLVDALGYLHNNGLAHSHIKPSNLLAIGDLLKLSTDTLLPIGDSRESYRDHDIYDAPENSANSTITASSAADIWSLSITLVEALTQQAPPLPFDDSADPAIPEALPEPFLAIARHALLRDPARRWNISQIAAHLNPVPIAVAASASATAAPAVSTGASETTAAASATATSRIATASPLQSAGVTVSPLQVPLSPEPAVPLAKFAVPQTKLSVPPARAPRRETKAPPENTFAFPSYVIPIALGAVVVLGAIFTLPKIFRRVSEPTVSTAASSVPSTDARPASSSTSPAPAAPATSNKVSSAPKAPPATLPSSSAGASPTDPFAESSTKSSLDRESAPKSARPSESTPAPAVIHTKSTSAPIAPISSTDSPDRGEVLDQVLPQASSKALATIHGTVRIVVRAHVDAAGNVSSADLDAPGPSKYFADLALRAAQNWKFSSPVSEGRSQSSQWLIRFEFTPTGATAFPTQAQR
jgi:TonB family protein